VGDLRSKREKQAYIRIFRGDLLKKYKMLKDSKKIVPAKLRRWLKVPVKSRLEFLRKTGAKARATVQTVHDFFEDDLNSVMSPEKRSSVKKGALYDGHFECFVREVFF